MTRSRLKLSAADLSTPGAEQRLLTTVEAARIHWLSSSKVRLKKRKLKRDSLETATKLLLLELTLLMIAGEGNLKLATSWMPSTLNTSGTDLLSLKLKRLRMRKPARQ